MKTILISVLIVACFLSAALCINADNGAVNVFIVPHSHCDVGWLQTIDGYYESAVKRILDNTVEALMKDPARKFIWVEIAFFYKWWKQATDTQRQQFRYLLTKTRQIEFIIGGFVMNDEALVTYGSIVDQMTLGNSFLIKEFGSFGVPRVGWQIDPFGASGMQTTLTKLMDFDYAITNRIDYITKEQYKKTKHLEFMWQGSRNLGAKSRIFSHILDSHYSAPQGFDWQRPYESPAITTANIKSRADELVKVFRERASWYATNNIMIPFGDDFEFTWAEAMFGNMTLLIDYINANPSYGFKLQFAKLTDYLDTVIKAKPESEWPVYEGDYQPYADNQHSFWTGYFTSVPLIKEIARFAERHARTAETLFSIARVERNIDRWSSFDALYQLRIVYANVMHHDGITGTEKMFVTQMYLDDIHAAVKNTEKIASNALAVLMQKQIDSSAVPFTLVRDFNALNQLRADDALNALPVVLYNSLGWERSEYVTIPMSAASLHVKHGVNTLLVRDETGALVPSQMYKSPFDPNIMELKFLAVLPALGYRTYYVQQVSTKQSEKTDRFIQDNEDVIINNEFYDIMICQNTGRICSITNRVSKVSVQVDQNFMAYNSFSNSRQGQVSGAYIFRPAEQYPTGITESKPITIVERGLEFDQVIQNFTSYASQVIRLYHKDPTFIEIEHLVGPIPINKEFITRFTTSINTDRELYTEQNALELIKKPYLTNTEEPVASNYNAMQYAAFIKDQSAQLTIMSDRSMGVASLAKGTIEMMLHRRCGQDDGRGLGEALNDTSIIRPKFRITVDAPKVSGALRHNNSYLLNFPIEVFAASQTVKDYRNFTSSYRTIYSPLSEQLPPNLHLLTLQAYDKDSTWNTLRFVNIFEMDETSQVKQYNENVNVAKLFSKYSTVQWQDMNLSTSRVLATGSGAPANFSLPPINFKTLLIEFEQGANKKY